MELSLIQASPAACFLCETDTGQPVYRVCLCDQYVHSACYARLLRVPSHETHCAVCRAVYDIRIVKGYRCRWTDDRSLHIAIVGGGCFVLSTIAVLLSYCDLCTGHNVVDTSWRIVVLSIATFTSTIAAGLCVLHRLATGRWACCRLRRVVVKRRFNLDATTST